MAFSNVDSLNLGNTLTIMFSEGIRQNLNLDYPEFELVQSMKAETTGARQIQYAVQTTLGPSSIQYRNPGSRYTFPTEQQTEQTEATAKLKELAATVSFEYSLYERLLNSKDKYSADRVKNEIESKNAALRRQICMDFYGDGTGVLGTISSVSISGGNAVVTLRNNSSDRGFAGMCQFGELVIHKAAAGTSGTAPTMSSGTFSYWKVVDRNADIATNTVTLKAYDSTGAALTTSSWSPSAGEVLYKKDQPSFANLSSISDYGTATEVMAGLEALIANDGRTVNGLTMSGALGATVYDYAGAQVDTSAIENAMNAVKNAVGKGKYKWPKAMMNRYVRSAFIDSRESDRRFVVATDGTRGVQKFSYEHDGDSIELTGAEFCPFNRIWILPEGKVDGHRVLEYHGIDFDSVKVPGTSSPWHLSPSGNAHQNLILMYLYGAGVIVNNHPAACVQIKNFAV